MKKVPKIGSAFVLLFTSVVAGQQPCHPQRPTAMTPFDACKYWPLVLGPGIHAPRVMSAPDPQYSETARKAKTNGTVVVALAINEKGGVEAVKVVRRLEPGLDQNAMDAVRQWKFAPATKDDKPMAVQMNVEITFDSK
jgi:TonB family protein